MFWHGKAGGVGFGTLSSGEVRCGLAGEAWLGWLRYDAVLQGMFWSVWAGGVRLGRVGHGTAWYGLAGEAWLGDARHGVVS
jgi:hypothetical protein